MKPIRIGHLYGNLLNTYGDYGNVLMLAHLLKKRGIPYTIDINSLEEDFSSDQYDFIFFGGGQDFEQQVVANHLGHKRDELQKYIENDGVLLAICGGYQLLGEYYTTPAGDKIKGAQLINYFTESANQSHRLVGDVTIKDPVTGESYIGYENHAGHTYLGEGVQPLGHVETGYGNNGTDQTEGMRYKNVFGSYFHGPMLVRNEALAEHIIDLILEKRQQDESSSTQTND
ncbi:type 1 glutamine amidotransferase [Atopobacter phocae]|uniref:type 1 glutamine amidotransferase n=1 Tax=Atopobacter phocae TaxID=136492 RepID=UPI00047236E1|nr:adenosylcobyric acid synthase [Atopobacter phocae]